MSERKTDEIKFRVTPTEKAAWQRYAADAQLGLSELIRREVNEGIRSNEEKQADALMSSMERQLQEDASQTQEIPGDPSRELLAPVLEVLPIISAPQEEVSSDEVGANEDGPLGYAVPPPSWAFEASRNA